MHTGYALKRQFAPRPLYLFIIRNGTLNDVDTTKYIGVTMGWFQWKVNKPTHVDKISYLYVSFTMQ